MSARTRRSLTLLWTALFLCSLAMQYVQLAVPAPVLAVHDDAFQLDGDAVDGGAGDDWANHPSADAFTFVTDPVNDSGDIGFTGGGSKDDLNTSSWQWVKATVQPDKDDITNAYAALYGDNLYFGADRYANNGDAALGFWFFRNGISLTGSATSGGFTPVHSVGDLLVISHFENGGTVAQVQLYEWVGTGGDTNGTLDLLGSGVVCTAPPVDDIACAIANSGDAVAPWAFSPKSGTAGTFPANSFLEGGLDLVALYDGNPPCFSSFLVETRSSQSVDATLKDIATGAFDTCTPPTIATQASSSTADFGQSVTDTATLSGSDGPASGSVTFFLCSPAQVTAAGCPTGGTQVGGAVPVTTSANGGTATSPAYVVGQTAAAVGRYCWRAAYTPDAASQYLVGSHTNATTECFTVAPATIDIDKVADPAGPVSAGASIAFVITVTNSGSGTALGVSVSDALPAGLDWSLGATSGATTGLACSITGSVGSEVLGCTKASLGAGQSFSVRVTAVTDATDCGTVNNSASVLTSNDGSDTDPASVVVQCPDVTVSKTPDGGSVNAGDPAVFTIVVSNLGPGSASNVTLTDQLPAGYTWTLGGPDQASCSIATAPNPDVLSCSFGTLASGATRTITLSAPTTGANCATIPNTATVAATNQPASADGNDSDSGSIDVLCAQIDIAKTANPAGPVNAGDEIGFDITVVNNGDGTATGVRVSDSLPAGIVWTVDAPTGDTTGVTCAIDTAPSPDVLTCTDAGMAPGDSFRVHLHGVTDAADCGTVSNTAGVTTGNDGSDSDDASVVVLCPDVTVLKTADADPIDAGDPIGFTITVSNIGQGVAYDVSLLDTLPAGIAWAEDSDDCQINASTLSCSFDSIPASGSVQVHLTGTTDAADCGTIPNTATVGAANEPAAATGNNRSSDSVLVRCPDVTVLKTADADPVSAGDPIGFTITVRNLGPGIARDVTLRDTLPSGIAWSEDSTSCSIAAGLLSCAFGDLASGASAAVHLTGRTDAADCGTIPNTATVGATNEAAAQAGNNRSSDSVAVLCPDLGIVKDGNGPLSAGEEASFTITVTNHGLGIARNVILTDTLPAGVAWADDRDECSIASGVLRCAFGDMASGDSESVTISGDTDAADCGTIPNAASVSATNEDTATDQFANSDDDSIVVDCPEIVITKTADASVVNAGDRIGFTITVTNTGDGGAFGVTVNDTLPAGLSWSESPDAAGWSIAGGVMSFGPATLPSGTSTSVHVVATTDAGDCGTIPNSAFLTYAGGSDSDDDTVTVECPDVTVVKDGNGALLNGDLAVFVITAWNQGPGVARDVTLADQLPAGDWTLGGDDAAACGIDAANLLTCEFGDLAGSGEGSSRTISISRIVTTDDCGTIPNLVSVGASNEAAADTGDNDDDAVITVRCPDVDIDKAADDDIVQPGQTVTYTLDVLVAQGPVSNAVVTDELPVGQTYVAGSARTDGVLDEPTVSPDGRTLTWTFPSLASGDPSVVITYDVTIDEDAASGDQENTVEICVDEPTPCADAVALVVVEDYGLLIDKANDAVLDSIELPDGTVIDLPTAEEGDTVTFTLDYDLLEDAVTDAVIKDVLPVGVTYVNGSATSDAQFTFVSYTAATRTLTWTAPSVATDGTLSYQVKIDVGASELPQPLVNVAVIDSAQTEPDDDDSDVFVPTKPLAATGTPRITLPPTDTFGSSGPVGNAGFSLMITLLALGALVLVVGFVTPVPASVRERERRR